MQQPLAPASRKLSLSPSNGTRGNQPDRRAKQIPAVLTISAAEEDHRSLAGIFRPAGWSVVHVWRLRDGLALLRENEAPVAICEDRLPDGDWRDVLGEAARLPRPPQVIVASRLADERLWAEVLHVGGYDLLLKPFQEAEVLWVATLAWQQTLRQRARGERAVGAATKAT